MPVDWLVALAGAMIVMLLVWLMTVLTVLWALRRSNRVDPSVRGTAPLTWLVSPGSAARLHRRIRGAVQLAHRVGRGRAGHHRELVSELSRHAVALDRELVVASAFPRPHRRGRLAALAAATSSIEASAIRLADLARASATPVPSWGDAAEPDGLHRLAERIDHLAGAHDELRRIEAVSPR
jgi:hypothetical protein